MLFATEELPALQLHQEKDCVRFAHFHMFFFHHPLLARTKTGCCSWHSHFRPSVVILQPCVKVLILLFCMQLILQLCVLQKMRLTFNFEGLTNRPGKASPPKSDLSNAQGPRYVSDASVSPPILFLCCTSSDWKRQCNPLEWELCSARASMADLEQARIWIFVPDVSMSARSSEVTIQTKELLSPSIKHLFCLTNC